ncbi:H+-transporting two-stor ATPase [Dyella thiooxydans]|uniref:ATP synthase subunit alpha n=1 Tax=Dyella thiooxydans TaxID=445710 RepID=A0A160MYH4_9GAMM|nr:F0F1 ATP synthase subunit alpha [Dyella thiooxydans]AND68393.1 H+-transporting two-stor ATPase [Dyella thiooxydans]
MPTDTPDATAGDWLRRSRDVVARARLGVRSVGLGHVVRIADGIAIVSGLAQARMHELLRFQHDHMGFVLSLDEDTLAAVLLDDDGSVEAGSEVLGTGEVLRVPVGPGLLGRVLDPLGRPLDRDEPVAAADHLPIERPAPAIIERDLVSEPVATGVLVIDAMFPIGRGQRELLIGDRATGKTSLAVDAMINQKHSDMVCVYVSVGQRAHAVQQVIEAVRAHGAPERTIFVVASASASAGLQWVAPFAGFSIAEYFRDRGQHALIVIDDLTKHAATHRELALLTHQPAGREAYPGDVFYLHARMLERAAKLSSARGGGSLTALPIAQTEAGNLAAYIPTNLISITDGQIVFDTSLFAADQRPAVDVGLSVSRVGGKAQPPVLREVAGQLRLQYSQFLELELFTRFGNLSDTRVKAQIARGRAIRALLTQPRFAAQQLPEQLAQLAALDDGVLDDQPADLIAELRRQLPARLAEGQPIPIGDALDPSTRNALVKRVRELVAGIAAAKGAQA